MYKTVFQNFAKGYQVTAIIILNTIIMLVIVEIIAGLMVAGSNNEESFDDPLGWAGNNPFARVPEQIPYYAQQEWGKELWNEYGDILGYTYFPYTLFRTPSYEGTTINVDENQLRVTPGANCTEDSYIVLTFGGSTMWGWGAPDWGTIPAYLQELLSIELDQPVCVINYSERAYISTQSLITLMLILEQGIGPDLIIFYEGANESRFTLGYGQANAHYRIDRISEFFDNPPTNDTQPWLTWIQSTNTFRLLRKLSNTEAKEGNSDANGLRDYRLGAQADTLEDEVALTMLANYQMLDALSQYFGFDFLFVWQPIIHMSNKPLTAFERNQMRTIPDNLRDSIREVYQEIEELAHDTEHLYYLGGVFDGYEDELFIDTVHVTPYGNQIIAEAIMDIIRNDIGIRATEKE